MSKLSSEGKQANNLSGYKQSDLQGSLRVLKQNSSPESIKKFMAPGLKPGVIAKN